MNFEERVAAARTRTFKAVFPGDSNHYDTLFGGVALQWMDECAFIAATRFAREKVVTVTSDRVTFKTPIPAGSLVELDAQISKVGSSSIEVKVNVYKEAMYSNDRELALTGTFVMVAIGEDRKPIKLGR